jgi:Holliday junction resolvase RusA-like endonuclease
LSEDRSVSIAIGYPGDCISVNHYRGRTKDGGEYVIAAARAWMNELGWTLKSFHLEDWRLPLRVECSGVFKDHRSAPDLSNLSKCTLDAIQEVTGINDRKMRWADGYRRIDGKALPELFITIKESPHA